MNRSGITCIFKVIKVLFVAIKDMKFIFAQGIFISKINTKDFINTCPYIKITSRSHIRENISKITKLIYICVITFGFDLPIFKISAYMWRNYQIGFGFCAAKQQSSCD